MLEVFFDFIGCFLGVFLTEHCEEERLLGVIKIVSIYFVVGLAVWAVYVAKVIDEFGCVLGRVRIWDSSIEIGQKNVLCVRKHFGECAIWLAYNT